MSRLRALAVFCYDFVVGEDWRLALGVILGLALTAVLVHVGATAWWILPVCVALALGLSLRRARRLVKAR